MGAGGFVRVGLHFEQITINIYYLLLNLLVQKQSKHELWADWELCKTPCAEVFSLLLATSCLA